MPEFVRFWTKADIAGFCPETVCPLMTQSGHKRTSAGAFSSIDFNGIAVSSKTLGFAQLI